MRDANPCRPDTPEAGMYDPDLALLALRYAAGELDPAGVEVFESRLGVDQTARDALAEAVRLSAAASGAPTPTPDPLLHEAVQERLHPTWLTRVFPRRPYRGHPLAWVTAGGSLAAVAVVVVGWLSTPTPDYASVPRSDHPRLIPAPLEDSLIPSPVAAIDGDPATPTGERLVRQPMDPLNNPKLNPMGLQDHSPVAAQPFPLRSVEGDPAAVAPLVEQKPRTDPRVGSNADPEQSETPPAQPDTKKG